MKDFFNLMYKVESIDEDIVTDHDDSEIADGEILSRQIVTISCVGIGYLNFSRGIK